jgi:hypothetical protein
MTCDDFQQFVLIALPQGTKGPRAFQYGVTQGRKCHLMALNILCISGSCCRLPCLIYRVIKEHFDVFVTKWPIRLQYEMVRVDC